MPISGAIPESEKMAASVEQLQALHGQMQAMKAELDANIGNLSGRMDAAGEGFTAEQKRLTDVFAEAEENWKNEQVRMEQLVDTVRQATQNLTLENLQAMNDRISMFDQSLLSQDGREETRTKYLHQYIHSESQSNTRDVAEMENELSNIRGRLNVITISGREAPAHGAPRVDKPRYNSIRIPPHELVPFGCVQQQ